jgi:hypothetical protein
MKKSDRITRRVLLKKTAAFAMASVSLQGCTQPGRLSAQHMRKDRPNIILVMADNVGFTEFGINGNNKIQAGTDLSATRIGGFILRPNSSMNPACQGQVGMKTV